MPRERSTWNHDEIAKRATVKTADPYLMNQDHVKVQPPADKYVTGDPSDFAEDVHPSNNTWEAEYSGGQVKRNEIGMPEMRGDTFNHPEKTASEEVLTKKAALCVAIARAMLPKTAAEGDIEEQSISFMYLPDAEVMSTYTRLASKESEDKEGDDDKEGQEQQAKQGGQMPPQFKENAEKKKEEAEAKKDDGEKKDDKGDDKKANQQLQAQAVQALQQGDMQSAQQMVQQAMQEQMQAQHQQVQSEHQQQAQQQVQALQQQVAQLQQQLAQMQQQGHCGPGQQMPMMGNQQVQAAPSNTSPTGVTANQQQMQAQQQQLQAAIQQAIQAGQDPVQAAQQIVQQMQQQGQGQQMQVPAQQQQMMTGDDALIDQMLASDGGIQAPVAQMDIELETPSMDVGEVQLGPEDDVLRQLFSNDEAQQAQQAQDGEQGQQKQAHAVRTASTRTVGTRPTQGVSQIGGGPSARGGSEVDKLSSLWGSAPNVKEAFGLPTDR